MACFPARLSLSALRPYDDLQDHSLPKGASQNDLEAGHHPYQTASLKSNLATASTALSASKNTVVKGSGQWSTSTIVLLSTYTILNLVLTFYNKNLLRDFPYPYLVTSIHAASSVVGCLVLRMIGLPFGKTASGGSDRGRNPIGLAKKTPTVEKQLADLEGGAPDHVSQDGQQQQQRGLGYSMTILGYSFLFAANIAVSNASLQLVSVPFHQIVRSTCPLFTLLLGMLMLAKRPSLGSTTSLVPIVVGAALSCSGSIGFTSLGFILTIFGTFLAALKTVVTNMLQGGGGGSSSKKNAVLGGSDDDDDSAAVAAGRIALHSRAVTQSYSLNLSALQLLEVMSPLACIQCLLVSHATGELHLAMERLIMTDSEGVAHINIMLLILLAGNGLIAFALNIASLKTNKAAGPLTMTVVGNLKQVVTILLAIRFYSIPVAPLNGIGIFVALAGTAWYGLEELRQKRKNSQQ